MSENCVKIQKERQENMYKIIYPPTLSWIAERVTLWSWSLIT